MVEKPIGNEVLVGIYEAVDFKVYGETDNCSLIEKYDTIASDSPALD